jgi:hypothetical protein
LDPAVQFPEDAKKLGRRIGVAHDVGIPMTFWILPASCKVIARSTMTALSDDEKADPVVQQQMAELDLSVKEKIRDTLQDDELDPEVVGLFPEVLDDMFLPDHDTDFDPAEPEAEMPEADEYMPEAYDEYLMAEVLLPNMGTVTKAKVIAWAQAKF